MQEPLVKSSWQPKEVVNVGHGCQCGITTDDGCFIVLAKDWDDEWRPTKWIPNDVAKRLGQLATNHCKLASTLQ